MGRLPVKSKTSTYVGARMGRPEKAKERTMTPKVHVLFPSGQSGVPRRDVIEASKKTITSLDIVTGSVQNVNVGNRGRYAHNAEHLPSLPMSVRAAGVQQTANALLVGSRP